MNILIVDDEELACNRLESQITEIKGYQCIASAANGKEALALYEKHNPEIVLLDIRMPLMDGLEAARHLSDFENPPAIIFTTAYDEHMLEAFETDAVDYLLKPIRKERLVKALNKVSRLNQAQLKAIQLVVKEASSEKQIRTHLCARERGGLILIPVDEIYYLRADSKYVNVVYQGGDLLIEESLKSLEKEFGNRFIRIHRATLVAIEYLLGLEKKQEKTLLKIRGLDEGLEVSRRHLATVRKIFKKAAKK